MQQSHQLVLALAEGLIAKGSMQAKLIHRADMRQGILRKKEKSPAIDFLGRFHRNPAGPIFLGLAHGQPIMLGLLIIALDVNLPGLAILIAGPPDIHHLHGLTRWNIFKMNF